MGRINLGGAREFMRCMPYPVKKFLKVLISPAHYLSILANDIRALIGQAPGKTRILFVAGYPKSGTTWVENFISHIPGYSPRVLSGSAEIIRMHGLPPDAFDRIPGYAYSSIKTHIAPSEENVEVLVKNGINKVLIMYRDPRDIVVSNYYHVLKSNPWKAGDPWYADYTAMSKEEGLSHSIELMVDDYCSWVTGWRNIARNNPEIDCLIVQYEELRNDPVEVFKSILSFFAIELDRERFEALMLTAEKKSSRFKAFGQPGSRSTKRKGTSGEWRNELNTEQQRLIMEKVGPLLVELGYEERLG